MQDKAELEKYKDLSVGEILRRARTKLEFNLEDIAAHVNIRPEILTALETDDYDRLPGKVYIFGFVRTYAEALGLDGDKIAYLLKMQSVGRDFRALKDMPKPIEERRLPGPMVIITSIGAFILLLIFWSLLSGNDRPPEIPDVEIMESIEP